MTKAETIERYGIEYYNKYQERKKEQWKNNQVLRDKQKEYQKERYKDPEFMAYKKEYNKKPEVKEYQKEYQKEYKSNNLNYNGTPKNNIRTQSNNILFKQRKHTKLEAYEIHHAFGYDDPSKFIYIPRTLHKAIHRFLKENNINADTDHYKYISAMINECTEYTYISA